MKGNFLLFLCATLGVGAVSAQDIVFQGGNKATMDNLPAPTVIESFGVTYDGQECLGQPNASQLFYADYANGSYTGIKYKVTAPAAGEYELKISYYTMDQRYISVKVSDRKDNIIRCEGSKDWYPGDYNEETGYKTPAVSTINVWLEEGENEIKVAAAPVYYGSDDMNYASLPNIYKFELTKVAGSDKTAADFADSSVAPIFVEAESGYEITNPEKRNPFHSDGNNGDNTGVALDMSAYALYRLNIPKEGVYLMRLWYSSKQVRPFVITTEDYPEITVKAGGTSSNWDSANAYLYVPVYLKEGAQTLKLSGDGKSFAPVVDCFELVPFEADWYTIPEKDTTVKYPQYALSSAAKYTSDIFGNLDAVLDFNEYTAVKSERKEGTVTVEFPWYVHLTGYGVATGNNTAAWKLEYSNDGENWMSLEMPVNFYKFSTKTITREINGNLYNNAIPVKYVRLTIAGDEAASLAEFTVYGYPFVSESMHNPSGLVTADNFTSNDNGWPNATGAESIGHIIDGLNTTWWTRNDAKDSVEIEVKLDKNYMLDSYLIAVPYRGGNEANRNLKEWTLTAGDEEISKVDNMNWVSTGAAVIIPVNQSAPSDTYKLTIPCKSVGQPHMSGFQLFAKDDVQTGVENVDLNVAVKVAALRSAVVFEGETGADYGIYAVNGAIVASGVVAEGSNTVSLAEGLYIVKIGDKAMKVIVK